jgi:hypothetical protein
MNNNAEDTYTIHLEYDPQKDDLSSSLLALSKIVEGHSIANSILTNALDQEVHSSIVLENIKRGSIQLLIKNVIKNTEDEEIKKCGTKAFIRQGLIELRKAAIGYMANHYGINSTEDILELKQNLIDAANNANARHTVGIESLSPDHCAEIVRGFTRPENLLNENQTLSVIINGQKREIPKTFKYNRARVEEIISKVEVYENQTKRIKIKQCSYEGESKWLVEDTDGKKYKAKILDAVWLSKFQNGNFDSTSDYPYPKTILKAKGTIKVVRDKFLNEKDRLFDIDEIIGTDGTLSSLQLRLDLD